MQVSTVALVLLLAALAGSWTLAAGAVLSATFAVAVAAPHERYHLRERHAAGWLAYRREVRDWVPRWRPYHGHGLLLLDGGCDACAAVWRLIAARDPRGLRLEAASERQTRAAYSAPGVDQHGVAAVTRALEHVSLGWAYAGWLLRLPGLGWLAQLVTDATLARPHLATGDACPIPSSGSSTAPSPRSGSTA